MADTAGVPSSAPSDHHVCISVSEEPTQNIASKAIGGNAEEDDWLGNNEEDAGGVAQFASFDDKLLHRAVRDACRWAYGTVFVEIWALSDDHTCLFRPEAGWWIDPVYHATVACNAEQTCELCRLTDARRPDGVAPTPLAPGEGLPGFLWSELAKNSSYRPTTSAAAVQSPVSLPLGLGSLTRKPSTVNTNMFATPRVSAPKHVMWRSIESIANDPDQPWSPRLQSIGASGLGWVAAVPFHVGSSSGIVMYMARPTVDWDRLTHPINKTYLLAAAHLAGSAYALRGPRHQVQQERKTEVQHTLSVVRAKILSLKGNLKECVDASAAPTTPDTTSSSPPHKSTPPSSQHDKGFNGHKRFKTVLVKMMGGGGWGPPAMGWAESFHVLIGVFLTLLVLSRLNVHVKATYGDEFAIVMGPFGALMTLLYGLSAAPASQPKNALLGQCVALGIAIGIGSTNTLPLWLKQPLATSLAVAVMVKLGLTHPPAGAAALIYSSGNFGWGNMLFMLIGNVIAIFVASFINNWSDKRQYPSYWGIIVPFIDRKVEAAKEAKKDA